MFKTIVLATDGSERSLRAAAVAGNLACKYQGCRVYVLNVIHELPSYITTILQNADIHYGPEMKEGAKELLKRTVQAMCLDGAGVELHTVLEYGKPAREIIKLAREVGADLIVIGNSNISEAEEFLTGAGISHKVVHHAPCNVLVVK